MAGTASQELALRVPIGSPNSKSEATNQSRVSHHSGKVSFPKSMKSPKHGGLSSSPGITSKRSVEGNPFKMANDYDVFTLREKERLKKREERNKQRSLKVHEKTTYTSQVNARTKAMIKPAGDTDDDLTDDEEDAKERGGIIAVKDDANYVLSTTRDRNIEKENLADYITKKRDMFLVQYSLGVKRDEMRKLEEIAQAEEKKLELAEQYLEEDAAMFDEFLKDNDKNAVEAIKIAELETKAKLEKVGEIKKINAQMMVIKSEIAKNEDTLKEYLMYKKFLDNLTPQEHKDKYETKKKEKKYQKEKEVEEHTKIKEKSSTSLRKRSSFGASTDRTHSRTSRKDSRQLVKRGSSSGKGKTSRQDADSDTHSVYSHSSLTDDEESDEEIHMYFADPIQLIDIFSELEEQNLSLIQNSQETEENLEEVRKTIQQTRDKMNKETEALKQQIESMRESIIKEEEKAKELEMKSKMFSYGEFQAEDQEKMLAQLNKKVEDVYRNCIGDNEANISTLQMLTNIENRLEELFEQIEVLPQDKVEMAEKAKEKERRLRMREEKLLAQKRHQEERVRRALERAQADPKKKSGRRLVFRSVPPQVKKREDKTSERLDREEEEMKYFFT